MARESASALIRRHYSEAAFGGFSRCDGTVAFLTRVQALLPNKGIVLDIGCGRGSRVDDSCVFRRDLQDLRGKERHVIGMDPDPHAAINPFIDEFRRLERPECWPIEDAKVNLAYSDYVLEHVNEPEKYFAELDRVLAPGGYFCARTPNRWGYASIAAQLIPNRFHAQITGFVQGDRKPQDVFPTQYKCNTPAAIRRHLDHRGYQFVVMRTESEPAYVAFSDTLFRIARFAHSLLPPLLRSTLLVFARKAP